MNQAMQYQDDMIRITALSFLEQDPFIVDIEQNDDINFHTISIGDGLAEDCELFQTDLVQSDLIVVVYKQVHIHSAEYQSRRQFIDDNYIATIWLNLDEINTYHSLAALRFISHMASMLKKNKLLTFNISDICSLIANSKSLRFLEANCEDLAIIAEANDRRLTDNPVKSIVKNNLMSDSAAMIIVTKEPISIRKINAGFEAINDACEHKVPCYYGVHMSPKYTAKHTYLYLVGER